MTFTNEKNRERMLQFNTDNRMGNRFLSFPDISTITDDDYNQVMKVSIHFDSLSQREEILRQIPKHLTFTNFLHLGGEITHSEYNKATAIQFVKNYYKEKYETVAMGDSENDLPMLEYADISIAMGNGVKEVKEKADYVTDKIDNDGLYKAFKYLMPSSFGLWFGAYAESLADDLTVLQAAYRVTNRNPLGSAAGYGSSFPLNREMTTRLLGFESMNYNVVYAQMGRGKTERTVANALAGIASTVSRLAFDACLYNSQNFGFIKLPDQYTTGSSIMPHKKNPDVFELTRAKCNRLQSLPYQITMILNNLPSGYFRDMQLIKEAFLPAFDELKSILNMVNAMLSEIKVNTDVAQDDRYKFMFSVEEVNRLTREGMPFRDAYKKVGLDIEAGRFEPVKEVHHTHEGSIGNLCNDRIEALFAETLKAFRFDEYHRAIDNLLK